MVNEPNEYGIPQDMWPKMKKQSKRSNALRVRLFKRFRHLFEKRKKDKQDEEEKGTD